MNKYIIGIITLLLIISVYTCNVKNNKIITIENETASKYENYIADLELKIKLDSISFEDSLFKIKEELLISKNKKNHYEILEIISNLPIYSNSELDSLWSKEFTRKDSLLW